MRRIRSSSSLAGRSHRNFKSKDHARNMPLASGLIPKFDRNEPHRTANLGIGTLGTLARLDA